MSRPGIGTGTLGIHGRLPRRSLASIMGWPMSPMPVRNRTEEEVMAGIEETRRLITEAERSGEYDR